MDGRGLGEAAEREAIMRQGVTLPETPRERSQLVGLAADLEGSPIAGRPLRVRLRNFRPSADSYLASLGGPLAYMVRLRRIARLTDEHASALASAWHELARGCAGDGAAFEVRWRETVAGWGFDEVNELIARHNKWFPAESRLPMDPATRDFALVDGRDYRRSPLDAAWALECWPPVLEHALAPVARPA
jgi:hypothetical protein